MDMKQHFYRLFAYDDWANHEALASLRATGASPPRSLRWLAHIIAAEWLWLSRLKQEPSPVPVWPEWTLEQCEAQMADLPRAWKKYLDGLTPESLAQPMTYTNSKGEPWTSRVEDILLHVVMHSAYHRGQMASDVRASGHTPAYTDFIHCVRQGFIE
jgi:uncharacterized damage-inducible protein DinB